MVVDEKAKQYSRVKLILSLGGVAYSCVLLLVFLFCGFSMQLREAVTEGLTYYYGAVAIFYAGMSFVFFVLSLPLDVYGGFVLEHRFGLSNQTFFQWCREHIKKELLSFLLGLLLVELVYCAIRLSPDLWWFFVWIVWIGISVVLGQLFPIVILPLFYKYSDIADASLKDRLMTFFARYALKVKDVYSINLSKTTKKANACFCGLGRTKRVILSDTLVANFTHDEIEVVLAHETGHWLKKHVVKSVLFNCGISLVTFFIVSQAIVACVPALGLTGIDDVAGMPLMGLVAIIVGFVLMPVQNMFSRRLENDADDFAADACSLPSAFRTAMEKLASLNLADAEPHPVVEFLFYSHPSIARRITRQKERKGAV